MTQEELDAQLKERFQELPKVLQEAITSTNVEKQLRELATKHKLHLDLWQSLENEVTMTLLGLQPAEELASHLQKDLEMPLETAAALAADISAIVFAPVREELERSLEHPDAKEEEMSDVETARAQVLGNKSMETPLSTPSYREPLPPTVKPATPPLPPPTQKANRAPLPSNGPSSGAYVPGEISTARKSVVDDPYREAPR